MEKELLKVTLKFVLIIRC